MLVFHEEIHRIASCATAKTFVHASGRIYIERRRFFVVKRTQAQEIDAPFFERDKVAYHLLYTGSFHYTVDGRTANHWISKFIELMRLTNRILANRSREKQGVIRLSGLKTLSLG
jgi:hypothetical protein